MAAAAHIAQAKAAAAGSLKAQASRAVGIESRRGVGGGGSDLE